MDEAVVFPNSCSTNNLIDSLTKIVGKRHVYTGERETRRFTHGFRFGKGSAIAVVRPGTLLEMWQTFVACIDSNVVVIPQASNTGLTGGSTPFGSDYDREVVIINTTRIQDIFLISSGEQAVCLPGSTLDQLERRLRVIDREPHSVIGSSCIGASIVGGICNNSGGSLIRRGPAYTELAVYARVRADGQVELVNHLGIDLGNSPEEILARLQAREFSEVDIRRTSQVASDRDYGTHVRNVDANTPARFNADARRLFEASGSAGKVLVFAVRLDTFPAEKAAKVFYIGTNDTEHLNRVRRHALTRFSELPIAGEYLHRDAYDMAATYGKDMFVAIEKLGTGRLPSLFAFKNWCDSLAKRVAPGIGNFSDRLLQWASKFMPEHLPKRMVNFRSRFDHHLMVKMSAACAGEMHEYLKSMSGSADADFFECSSEEARKAFLHRFVAASAAVRYRAVHSGDVEDIVALDIALRRNDGDWFEKLPEKIEKHLIGKLYYGHFFCHVFHQDYIVRKGQDCVQLEHELLELCHGRGAKFPAEHNVGHLYEAEASLQDFYKSLDPCNCMNPGIGQMSKFANYREPRPQAVAA